MNEREQAPWWAQYVIAVAIVLLFAGALAGVFWLRDANMMIAMIQAVINITMLAVGYFYGSSDGSKIKSQTIATIAQHGESAAQPVAIAVNNPAAEPAAAVELKP